MVFNPNFMLCFPWNFNFSVTAYHRDLKPVPLDLACFDPYLCATQAILMHFSQSKSTKCEIFGCLLNSPWPKNLKRSQFQQGKSVQKGLENLQQYRFVGVQCTMLELWMWQAFLSYLMVFLDFWEEGLDIGFWIHGVGVIIGLILEHCCPRPHTDFDGF